MAIEAKLYDKNDSVTTNIRNSFGNKFTQVYRFKNVQGFRLSYIFTQFCLQGRPYITYAVFTMCHLVESGYGVAVINN